MLEFKRDDSCRHGFDLISIIHRKILDTCTGSKNLCNTLWLVILDEVIGYYTVIPSYSVCVDNDA